MLLFRVPGLLRTATFLPSLALVVVVLGHFVFREELAGLGVAWRLTRTPVLVRRGRVGVSVGFLPLVVAPVDVVVLVGVLGTHNNPPAIITLTSVTLLRARIKVG